MEFEYFRDGPYLSNDPIRPPEPEPNYDHLEPWQQGPKESPTRFFERRDRQLAGIARRSKAKADEAAAKAIEIVGDDHDS